MALYRSAETAATVTLPDHSLEPTSRQSLGRRSRARLEPGRGLHVNSISATYRLLTYWLSLTSPPVHVGARQGPGPDGPHGWVSGYDSADTTRLVRHSASTAPDRPGRRDRCAGRTVGPGPYGRVPCRIGDWRARNRQVPSGQRAR